MAATLTDKCGWSPDSKDIYCGIPRQFTRDTVLPDDELRGEISSSDTVVHITVDTGDVAPLFDESGLFLSNILITKDQRYLLFVNRSDGTLWRYRIKE